MNWKTTLIVSLITIVYIVIGGVIFKAIEETNEEKSRVNATAIFEAFLNKHNCVSKQEAIAVIENMVGAFKSGILRLDNSTNEINWNLYNSIFFALTIVTTIGYGNMAPITQGGRSFCIFYTLIGIPLMLLALAGIGELLNRLTNFIREKIPNMDRCCSPRWQRIFSTLITTVLGLAFLFFVPAAIFQAVEEDWTYRDALYYCFITLTTVGFGDFVAGWPADQRYNRQGWYRTFIIFWIFVGLSWVSGLITACLDTYQGFANKTEEVTDQLEDRVDEIWNDIVDDDKSVAGSKTELKKVESEVPSVSPEPPESPLEAETAQPVKVPNNAVPKAKKKAKTKMAVEESKVKDGNKIWKV